MVLNICIGFLLFNLNDYLIFSYCFELFCFENAFYCPYCDISKYVTPQYIREIVKEMINDYQIIK